MKFPATSIEVKRADVLHSHTFARQLDVLMSSEFQDAISVSQKSGEIVEEVRDVNNTIFISGWLPALLVTNASTQSFGDIPRIEKKIRDGVVRKNSFGNKNICSISYVQVYRNALLPFRRSGMWTTVKVVLNISLVRDLNDVDGLFLYKVIIVRFMLKFLQSPEFPARESTGIEMLKTVRNRIANIVLSLHAS